MRRFLISTAGSLLKLSVMSAPPPNRKSETKISKLVPALLDWFAQNARDLPWRRTRDPYAIWVSEIMLQQTQVKTVIPFWERWMRELPTIEAAANASSDKLHKLWEGLGYYTRVRNLQKAAQQIVARRRDEFHESQTKNKIRDSWNSSLRNPSIEFPKTFDDVLALPGIGRYTAGAICSIAFNQPTPILDGNVIRVLTRIFGIAENPKEKKTNARLWQLAEELVTRAKAGKDAAARRPHQNACSHLNQSLMELGALICAPKNPQCLICPVQKWCVAFKEKRAETLPNLGKRETATPRTFVAFALEYGGKFLVRQRPAGVVNAHLWEFPNVEIGARLCEPQHVLAELNVLRVADPRSIKLEPLCTVKHSITRYRITLEAFLVHFGGTSSTSPHSKSVQSGTRGTRPSEIGAWKTPAQMRGLAFTAAHKKLVTAARQSILSG
jgi:A/G-specific adenine glycosylase